MTRSSGWRWQSSTSGEELVELADGVRGPGSVAGTRRGGDVEVDVELVHDGERYTCAALTIRQPEGADPITPATLRRLTLADLLRQATGELVVPLLVVDDPGGKTGTMGTFTLPKGVAGHGPTDEALRWVARVYRVAYAVGWEPRQEVARAFGIKPDTASAWIRRARADGRLGATTSGKAGI